MTNVPKMIAAATVVQRSLFFAVWSLVGFPCEVKKPIPAQIMKITIEIAPIIRNILRISPTRLTTS